jgi:hypothetical protein
MSNLPQPIAVHRSLEFQHFRKGECGPYKNPVLYSSPNIAMTSIMAKRDFDTGTATVTLVDLEDNDITTFTPTSVTSYPLDDEGEYYCLVLGAGNWVGAVSVSDDTYYYFRIESGAEEYYTDEFYLMPGVDNFPEVCNDEVWAKLSYTLDGSNVYTGFTTANPASAVHAFPQTPITFYMFLDSALYQPEWEQETEGEPNGHGQTVVSRTTLKKRWRLGGVPVSDSIIDALNISALATSANLQLPNGATITIDKNISVEANWQQGGCFADYSYLFENNYFVKQGC